MIGIEGLSVATDQLKRNNIIDLGIWMIIFLNHGESSFMMLVSIGYFLINIYGIIKWSIEAKNVNNKSLKIFKFKKMMSYRPILEFL